MLSVCLWGAKSAFLSLGRFLSRNSFVIAIMPVLGESDRSNVMQQRASTFKNRYVYIVLKDSDSTTGAYLFQEYSG